MALRLPIRASLIRRTPISAHQLPSFTTTKTSSPFQPIFHHPVYRNMATSVPKIEWLVVVPDKPNTLAKRLEVRPTHFKNLNENLENGVFRMGGAILDEPPATADAPATDLKFAGSTLVMMASSKEEVMAVISKDVYVEAGVWDLEKVQMWPLKLAFMKEKPAP